MTKIFFYIIHVSLNFILISLIEHHNATSVDGGKFTSVLKMFCL